MGTPERIWFLMSRNLSGEASEQERDELMVLLQQLPDRMQQYETMKRLWEAYTAPQEQEPVEAHKISRILQLSAAEDALNDPKPVRGFLRRLPVWKKTYRRVAVAAGLLIAAWSFAQWYVHSHKMAPAHEIVAQRGSKTRTILPDGSTVWLNAGSVISYDPDFNGPNREVTLRGEAYFDVVASYLPKTGQKRSFVVHAGNINIRVLGTAFNVKSYEDDKTIETTLIRGLVQITKTIGKAGPPIYLHPNQKIILSRGDEDAAKSTTQAESKPVAGMTALGKLEKITYLDTTIKENERVETAWIYNRLEFRGDSFEELAKKLERWYNITIHFEDEAASRLKFNGSLENETVEQAFLALKAAVPFNFKMNNNEIFITSFEKPVP